jgi:AcrR family transcriptional regulator
MDKDDDRRNRIMAEGAVHFLRDGFERTGIDRIAAGAKVSKQTIYDYFASKEDLFEQVVRAEMRNSPLITGRVENDINSAVTKFAIDVSHAFVRPRNFGLFRANLIATRRFPVLASALHDHRRGASQNLGRYLDEAAARDDIARFDCNGLDLATRLGGMAVEGTRYFLGNSLPPARERTTQARLASAVFLHGYRGVDAAISTIEPAKTPSPIAVVPNEDVRMRLSEQRFDNLCTVALSEFLDSGFQGACIDKVSATTGIGRSTIYRQFGNKEGLFRFIVARKIDQVRTETIDSSGGTHFEQRVENLARNALDAHLEPQSIAMHQLLIQEAIEFPDLAKSYYDALVIRAGLPFGRLVKERGDMAPTEAVIRAFYTLATFGVRYIASLDSVEDHQRMVVSRQVGQLICSGVLPACSSKTSRSTESARSGGG